LISCFLLAQNVTYWGVGILEGGKFHAFGPLACFNLYFISEIMHVLGVQENSLGRYRPVVQGLYQQRKTQTQENAYTHAPSSIRTHDPILCVIEDITQLRIRSH
jgi:hypothetical protein